MTVTGKIDLGHDHDAELASSLDPAADLVDRVAPTSGRRRRTEQRRDRQPVTAPGADGGQLGVAVDRDSPRLVVGEVEVEPIELAPRRQIDDAARRRMPGRTGGRDRREARATRTSVRPTICTCSGDLSRSSWAIVTNPCRNPAASPAATTTSASGVVEVDLVVPGCHGSRDAVDTDHAPAPVSSPTPSAHGPLRMQPPFRSGDRPPDLADLVRSRLAARAADRTRPDAEPCRPNDPTTAAGHGTSAGVVHDSAHRSRVARASDRGLAQRAVIGSTSTSIVESSSSTTNALVGPSLA